MLTWPVIESVVYQITLAAVNGVFADKRPIVRGGGILIYYLYRTDGGDPVSTGYAEVRSRVVDSRWPR